MGQKVGCTKVNLSSCERGAHCISLNLLNKICEKFSVNPKWLLGKNASAIENAEIIENSNTTCTSRVATEDQDLKDKAPRLPMFIGPHASEMMAEVNRNDLTKRGAPGIAHRLKKLRLNLGLSQNAMSKISRYSEGLLYAIEKGKCKPSLKLLRLLCEKYNANPKWLIDGEMDQPMWTTITGWPGNGNCVYSKKTTFKKRVLINQLLKRLNLCVMPLI